MRSIGCCNTATTSCRNSIWARSGSPIGTSSAAPRSRRNTGSGSTPGGSIQKRSRRSRRRRARSSSDMIAYAIRRILLMIPTLFAVMVVNFIIVQAAPGGPVQQMIAKLRGSDVSATERVTGGGGEIKTQSGNGEGSSYRGARGLDPAFIKQLEKQYGFDKPPLERFALMM